MALRRRSTFGLTRGPDTGLCVKPWMKLVPQEWRRSHFCLTSELHLSPLPARNEPYKTIAPPNRGYNVAPMRLLIKFNLVLILVFGSGVAIAGYLSHQFLERSAREQVLEQARSQSLLGPSARELKLPVVDPPHVVAAGVNQFELERVYRRVGADIKRDLVVRRQVDRQRAGCKRVAGGTGKIEVQAQRSALPAFRRMDRRLHAETDEILGRLAFRDRDASRPGGAHDTGMAAATPEAGSSVDT